MIVMHQRKSQLVMEHSTTEHSTSPSAGLTWPLQLMTGSFETANSTNRPQEIRRNYSNNYRTEDGPR